ncbi:MAG: cytochrome b/b6 domain-containing protein [Gammaproteobacteria bacterium]|nr:MAG: cytochrome b/b6 domain-containing protein [Gammaproteobacteria bacterium]
MPQTPGRNTETLRRVQVWGGWLRLAHALLALSTLVLIGTGWLVAETPSVAEVASDIHYYAASLLVVGLLLRGWLLFFGSEGERIDQLVPGPGEGRRIREMLLFYLSLGRARLPHWYSHNPLWKPLYLLLLLILLVMVISGGFMQSHPLVWKLYLPTVHAFWASVVGWLVLLHVVAVVWHDYKGGQADVSAIINGWRIFPVDRSELPPAPLHDGVVARFDLDALKQRLPRGDSDAEDRD